MQDNSILEYKEVVLNMSKGIVEFHKNSTYLTKNEMNILYMMMKYQGKIVSREEIMNDLWVSDEFADDNMLIDYARDWNISDCPISL